jgi:arginase family enzyme
VRRIAVLDAPSNLGLRPPTATSVPGCAKAPGALRDQGLLAKLGARDAGCLTPPRYDPGDWRPGDGVAHAAEISAYSRALADRIGAIIDGGEFPVVLGGDCSILIGAGIAMHRLGDAVGGRIGLVFVDGHSDFRHPGNASYVGAAAGEDLALVTGRGQADLAAIESRRPYFRDIDVVVLGIRAQDEYRLDLQAAGIVTRPVPALRAEGAARSAQWARDQLVDCAGYWVHVDVDVLDPAVMPAVDAPDPGGIAFPELEILLSGLVESPHCLGVEITVFDPDYDPDSRYAAEITSAVVSGLSPVRATSPRPDLIAARRDLNNTPDRAGPRTPRGASRLGPAVTSPVPGPAAASSGPDLSSVPEPAAASSVPDLAVTSQVPDLAAASSVPEPAAASVVLEPPVTSSVPRLAAASPVPDPTAASSFPDPTVTSSGPGRAAASSGSRLGSGSLFGSVDGLLPAAGAASADSIADPVVASAVLGQVVDHSADGESPAGSSAGGLGPGPSTEEPSADLDASSTTAPHASAPVVPGSVAPAPVSEPSESAPSESAPSESAPSETAVPTSTASVSASASTPSAPTTAVPFPAGVAPEPEAALAESPAGDAEFVLAAALGQAGVTSGKYPVGILADRDAPADLDLPGGRDASGDRDGPATRDRGDDTPDDPADEVGRNGRSDSAGKADRDASERMAGGPGRVGRKDPVGGADRDAPDGLAGESGWAGRKDPVGGADHDAMDGLAVESGRDDLDDLVVESGRDDLDELAGKAGRNKLVVLDDRDGRDDPAGSADPDALVGEAGEDEVAGGGGEPGRTGSFDWIGAPDSIDADGSPDVVGDAADADPGSQNGFADVLGDAAVADPGSQDGSADSDSDSGDGDGDGDEPADTRAASDEESEAAAAADSTDDSVITREQEQNDTAIRLLSRPLGSAPLLDSEPLPATRPGMLRPRPPADSPASGGLGSTVAGTGVTGGFPPGVA